jgi:hypothetical protein
LCLAIIALPKEDVIWPKNVRSAIKFSLLPSNVRKYLHAIMNPENTATCINMCYDVLLYIYSFNLQSDLRIKQARRVFVT